MIAATAVFVVGQKDVIADPTPLDGCFVRSPDNQLNLRASPMGDILSVLKNGDIVIIWGDKRVRSQTWVEVGFSISRSKSLTGWVNYKYLDCESSRNPVSVASEAGEESESSEQYTSTASNSESNTSTASKDETLAAIKEIYDGQGDCHVDNNSEISTFYNSFAFLEVDQMIGFMATATTISSFRPQPLEIGWVALFNPADLEFFQITQGKGDSNLAYLTVSCRGGGDCIDNRTHQKKSSQYSIPLCNVEKAKRIQRAIVHLSSFYEPTKELPF
ncbi:MAG: SH3 domain-containing protein [Mesorhizobium sp.]|nr:MAG: SH3 domain-containing protein [Mesorhizobium sp.]